jgi:ribose transport system substrate-binding protein
MTLKGILLAGAAFSLVAAGPGLAQDVPELNEALEPVEGSPMVEFEASDKDSFVIGFSNISVANTWRVQMAAEAAHEASLHPQISQFISVDAGGDVSQQVADIEGLVSRGVDAIIVAPGSPVALNGALDDAYDAGIPVVIFSSNATPENYAVKLLADDAQFGRDGAEYLAEAMGGSGNIIALRGISGNSIDNDRWRGVEEVLADYPDIRVVDSGFADWAYDRGRQVCESLVIAHPDLQGIWSSGGAMTQACAEVLEENGLPMVPMTGEANNGFLRIWQEMDLDSIAPISPTWFGQQAVVAALRVLEGAPTHKDYLVNPPPITEEQIAEFYNPDLNDSYWVGSTLPEEMLMDMYGN